MIEIHISSGNAHFEQENEVFKTTFILEFEWILRENIWLLHIFDSSHNPLALGIKMQVLWPFYTYTIGRKRIVFMLLPKRPGVSIERHNLKDNFVLVAYEAV